MDTSDKKPMCHLLLFLLLFHYHYHGSLLLFIIIIIIKLQFISLFTLVQKFPLFSDASDGSGGSGNSASQNSLLSSSSSSYAYYDKFITRNNTRVTAQKGGMAILPCTIRLTSPATVSGQILFPFCVFILLINRV